MMQRVTALPVQPAPKAPALGADEMPRQACISSSLFTQP